MSADEYREWFAKEYDWPVEMQRRLGMVPVRCDHAPNCKEWVMEFKK